ncbi:PQQ-dependent sugar dehydrogenase [Roseinatronobacter monicus]|uniref:Glucose/arabinose dehydrogenase n=1 Tax=Roseinatronobacter monicus TaxID=393481 RepID=A0A543K4B3_9RHOB|nr:PQQ-dependent sugar dehydrogenase [Roseinatronobacter monicus]TQM89923.1 glucose/arabinose dehydrogenase [Roseinatronobacter monicus]
MKRSHFTAPTCAAILSITSLGVTGTAALAQSAPDLDYETVLTDLDNPWDMAFLPDGTMFYTEKCLGLSVLLPSGETNALLGMTGSDGYASTADDLFCEGQAGMMGIALDPEFDDNRFIYVYSTSSMQAPGTNRLMRFVVSNDLSDVSDRTDLIEDVPYKPEASDQPFGGPGAHNGGRVRFGPDGYLYLTTGDIHGAEVPQSPTLLGGKVVRIDRDGNAAEGNNAPEGFDARIYTYGHRNVQGIAFHPQTGQPIAAEHGPWHSDEITALVPGGNGGWDPRPNRAGRGDCPDGYCGYEPVQMEAMEPAERAAYMPMTDFDSFPDAMPPAWTNNGLSQGMTANVFLIGDHWGGWEGHMAVGFMGIGFGGTPVGQRIDLIDIADDGQSVNDVTEMPLPMGQGRFRALVLGPDGALYAAIDEGDIYRIMPN